MVRVAEATAQVVAAMAREVAATVAAAEVFPERVAAARAVKGTRVVA